MEKKYDFSNVVQTNDVNMKNKEKISEIIADISVGFQNFLLMFYTPEQIAALNPTQKFPYFEKYLQVIYSLILNKDISVKKEQ